MISSVNMMGFFSELFFHSAVSGGFNYDSFFQCENKQSPRILLFHSTSSVSLEKASGLNVMTNHYN